MSRYFEYLHIIEDLDIEKTTDIEIDTLVNEMAFCDEITADEYVKLMDILTSKVRIR